MEAAHLARHPVHLGRGATAVRQPQFTGAMEWYDGYLDRHGEDGTEGRLVSWHSFSAPWPMWEMHPHGSELVICTAGVLTLVQQQADGSTESVDLQPGEYAVNPPGV